MKYSRTALTGLLGLGLLLTAACSEDDTSEKTGNLKAEAASIAQESLIIDTHIDVPYRLRDGWIDVIAGGKGGQFDYPRAVSGGLNAPFMSIYTPASFDAETAFAHAEKMIAVVEKMELVGLGKFKIARSPQDVLDAKNAGLIALPLGMENGSPLGTDLSNLDYFAKRGISYITLAHSLSNAISDSSYSEERPHEGLSDFGKAVVGRMNELGIMVDISHVSDDAFYDVMALTAVPAIASHSSARHFTPGFERNMSDDMIKLLADQGGVIMINYGSAFLTEDANKYQANLKSAYTSYLAADKLDTTDTLEDQFEQEYKSKNPYPFATVDDVLDHIDHVVKIGGINAIGIGSDYDGVGDTLPTGLKDVSSYPALIEGLLGRGYSRENIDKILGGNLMRVWRTVQGSASSS